MPHILLLEFEKAHLRLNMKSMRRVLRYDGVLPVKMSENGAFVDLTPADIQAIKVFIEEQRTHQVHARVDGAVEFEGASGRKGANRG